jgi:hypothetical protein
VVVDGIGVVRFGRDGFVRAGKTRAYIEGGDWGRAPETIIDVVGDRELDKVRLHGCQLDELIWDRRTPPRQLYLMAVSRTVGDPL